MSEWKVQIKNGWAESVVEILIYRDAGGGKIEVVEIENPVMTRKVYQEYEPIEKASLKIEYLIARSLLPSLAEAIDKHGTKMPSKSFAEGELAAIKIHLDDMRKLVFK